MKVKDVLILKEAVDDLNEGRAFYDIQEPGVGDYFWDCMISDIIKCIRGSGFPYCGLLTIQEQFIM